MSSVTQIAFQIDDEMLSLLDGVAASAAQSRAEVLRAAVREFLARRAEEEIDARMVAGYAETPPGSEEDAFASASLAGFKAMNLDW